MIWLTVVLATTIVAAAALIFIVWFVIEVDAADRMDEQ